MHNVYELRIRMEALLREYPDLMDDEELRADMLDAETDLYSALTTLINKQADAATLMGALSERLESLTARRARFGRRCDFLRDLMLMLLQSANLKRIELPDATLSQRNNPPQIIGEVDVNTLPDEFVRIKREPNRTAIREALLDHREVPGLSLSNAPPGLLIKVK